MEEKSQTENGTEALNKAHVSGSLPSWEELVNMKEGSILKDWFDEGVRCLIIRGPASICAYVGVQADHPLAGHNYDNIPVRCHYGLTFSGEGDGTYRPKGYYWYGWDYAHSGDYCFYYDSAPLKGFDHSDDKKWGVKEVEDDMWSSVYDFKMLIRLVEAVAKKANCH